MDKQTIFKEAGMYYQIHREKLLKEGCKIAEDTKEKTVFIKKEKTISKS